jgi:hypothetical protein
LTTKNVLIRPLFAIFFAATLLVALLPRDAQAAQSSEDISGSFVNHLCTGEPVILDGTVHMVTNTTDLGGGTFRVQIHINTQGVSGVGFISGDDYNFNNGVNQDGDFNMTAGGSAHWVGHTEFIHQGEGNGLMDPHSDDEHVHFNTTVNLDTSGNPIVVPVPDFECR